MTMRRVATLSEELDAHDITPDMQGEPLGVSLLVAGLCNNARRHPEFGYVGAPTETALLEFAERAGAPLDLYERTNEVPFTSERRMMSVAVKRSGRKRVYCWRKARWRRCCRSVRASEHRTACRR